MDRLMGIEVFNAVARLGSFSAAAEELNISRAMASKYVSELESRLGARLLNRTTRQLSLTEVGRGYSEQTMNILAELQEAESSVADLQSKPIGTLKILSPPSFGSFHLSRAISGYGKQYPDVNIELILTDRVSDLIEEGVDMAVRIGQLADSSLVARQLSNSRLIVCGSPDYFEKNGIPQTPSDLFRFNCLVVESSNSPLRNWRFNIKGLEKIVKINGSLTSNFIDALRITAIHGYGLVQLPSYVVGFDIKSGRLKPVLQAHEPNSLAIHVVYAHRKLLSIKMRTFIDFLQQYFKSSPYWDE